jgi:enamine deaminase RidA (YjgF/YER057c/UK114 family)
MQHPRDAKFDAMAAHIGYSFEGEIKIGGNYTSVVQHGTQVYVSGQIPRVGNEVVVVGRVGDDVTLANAQLAAKICAMRALALLRQSLGTLEKVGQVLRITVFVQSAPDFTQQSEVADGASEVLYAVLGEAGSHTRTSVGVYQLPKGAAVELDLIAAIA